MTERGVSIENVTIDPVYVAELCALGPVLKIRYQTSSGVVTTSYFRHTTFLSGRASRELRDGVAAALGAWSGRTGRAVETRPAATPSLTLPEPGPVQLRSDQRALVALASDKAAFPLLCPVCCGEASRLGTQNVSAGDSERGMWLVPTCHAHGIGDAIRIEKWRATATDIAFSFANPDYAREFARANAAAQRGENQAQQVAGAHLAEGLQFVVYSYAVSAIYFGALLNSKVIPIRIGESRVSPGIRYSLLTAILGWWSIPGLFFSVAALRRNWRGGTDVTGLARAALGGVPVSAYGVS